MPDARRRVLQVGPVPPPIDGGIAAYLDGLLRSSLAERFDLPTCDVHVPAFYRRQRWARPWLSLRFVQRLRRRMRETHPHLVHIHTSAHRGFWEKATLARLVSRAGVPHLLHLHGGDFDEFFGKLSPGGRARAAKVLGAAAGVIVLSEDWRRKFTPLLPEDRWHVVPNAIHTDDFAPGGVARTSEPVRLLFMGMLSPRKGLDELHLALLNLRRQDIRFHLDILGDEEFFGEHQRYRMLFEKSDLGDCVVFHGLKSGAEKKRFLQQADIFVLPSRSESFGIVNLEAMACGLPVISTRTGAIPEYLHHEVHGLLVDPGDASALGQALVRLIADSELRIRLGAQARLQAQHYDWNRVSGRLAQLYESCQRASAVK